MSKLPASSPALKRCTRCGESKPPTPEFFVLVSPGVKSRQGVTSPCRVCHKHRMKKVNRESYKKDRARHLLRTYRSNDSASGRETTISRDELAALIEQPCHYCGTTDAPRGADRIENDVGHTLTNTLPACQMCNMVRNNLFSIDEMRQLGVVIAKIVEARL